MVDAHRPKLGGDPAAPGSDMAHFDVAIVGFGPTGATLANLLALSGLRIAVLDRAAAAYHLPRAVHFDDEVMRVFQAVGIARRLAALCHVNPGMRFVAPDGRLLLDWPRDMSVTSQGWRGSYRFHQPCLERLLRDALGRFDGVRVGTRCLVQGLEDDGDRVRVRFDDLDAGCAGEVTADYVVGCDGANSLVRAAIGSVYRDFGFDERWLVIDARLKRPMPELGDYSIQFCGSVRPATYVRGTGDRRRWEISLLDTERDDDVRTPDAIWALLSRWITPEDAEVERSAVYTFRSSVADRWRRGRIFLAGDAAHLTPPFMGQGMCAGIRDASNLAWKLAAQYQRGRRRDLLDTYESERAPHAQAYIETAVRLGGVINTAETEAGLRAALSGGDGDRRMASIAPRLGQGHWSAEGAHGGTKGWQVIDDAGRMSDDVAGSRFQLIATPDLCAAAPSRDDLWPVASDRVPAAQAYLDHLKTRAVLLRPDRYVYGTADDAAGLQALLAGLD